MDKYPHFTIGQLCNIEKGETGIASAITGDYPLVNTSAERKSCNTYQFDTEAVCIPLVSSTGHGKKTLNYVHYQKGKFALGTILAAVIPKEPRKLSAAFLHRYLQFYKDRKIVPLMKGAANVSLAIKDIVKIEVPVPPISEQKSFIELFNKLNDSSTKLQSEFLNQSSYLSLLRQAILQEAIEGKLTAAWRKKNPKLISGDNHASKLLEKIKTEKERLIKEGKIRKDKPLLPITKGEEMFALPYGWVWCRLGDWGVTQTGTTPSTFDTANTGCFIPFIKPADISLKSIDYANEGLSEKGLEDGRLILKGSVLMVCIGGSIGKSYFTDRNVSCNQQINCITPLARIESKLLQFFLQSKYFQFEVWDKAMKSSTPIINKGKWEAIPLPMPTLAEQQAIVERVEKLMAIIDELGKQVTDRKDKSERLMQSVLREAFESKG